MDTAHATVLTKDSGPEDSPGLRLMRARERKGMSIEDVARALYLSKYFVIAIENNDFAKCPGAVYARGHLRSYAQLVDCDGDELVRLFDEMDLMPQDPQESVRVSLKPQRHFKFNIPEKRVLIAWSLLVTGVGVLAYILYTNPFYSNLF